MVKESFVALESNLRRTHGHLRPNRSSCSMLLPNAVGTAPNRLSNLRMRCPAAGAKCSKNAILICGAVHLCQQPKPVDSRCNGLKNQPTTVAKPAVRAPIVFAVTPRDVGGLRMGQRPANSCPVAASQEASAAIKVASVITRHESFTNPFCLHCSTILRNTASKISAP
jgi:hypothetical protein